jgi:hypothetical protein
MVGGFVSVVVVVVVSVRLAVGRELHAVQLERFGERLVGIGVFHVRLPRAGPSVGAAALARFGFSSVSFDMVGWLRSG